MFAHRVVRKQCLLYRRFGANMFIRYRAMNKNNEWVYGQFPFNGADMGGKTVKLSVFFQTLEMGMLYRATIEVID